MSVRYLGRALAKQHTMQEGPGWPLMNLNPEMVMESECYGIFESEDGILSGSLVPSKLQTSSTYESL